MASTTYGSPKDGDTPAMCHSMPAKQSRGLHVSDDNLAGSVHF